ncbi:MAG: VOC family protein [Pseudomonadales bacterium]
MNTPPFVLNKLDHIVLRTTRLKPMLDFYQSVLGAVVERQLTDEGLYQLRAGESLIDIVSTDRSLGARLPQPPNPDAANLDHFCLTVSPWSPAAIRRYLSEHDIECGEVAIRYGAEGFGESLYIYDPDGNQIELKQPK